MTVRLGSETDSFEDVVPVEILASAGNGGGVWPDRR